jgi:hypothetical protein
MEISVGNSAGKSIKIYENIRDPYGELKSV